MPRHKEAVYNLHGCIVLDCRRAGSKGQHNENGKRVAEAGENAAGPSSCNGLQHCTGPAAKTSRTLQAEKYVKELRREVTTARIEQKQVEVELLQQAQALQEVEENLASMVRPMC